MPTITLDQLENAALDADHIAEIATSASLSATDRLGVTKQTLAGALNAISGITVRGAWVTSTAYGIKDVVSNAGTWYVVLVAHTSGTFGTDLAAGKMVVYQGALSADLAASGGSALLGFLQAGTGATARTVQAKARDILSVKDFGATGDGTTADQAAIQAAIDYAESIGGAMVLFPRGTYRITSGKLTIEVGGVYLVGEGVNATTLHFDNGSSDCIDAHGTDTGANQLNGFGIRDMSITHGSKTSGRTLMLSYAYKAVLENLLIENCWTGFEMYITNNVDLRNINFQMVLGGGSVPAHMGPAGQAPENCYGLFWHAPSDGTARSDALRTINVTIQAVFSGADGCLWDGAATTWDAFQLTCLSCNYGLRIRNTGASNANYPQFGEFTNFNTDGAMTQGVRIEAGSTYHFQGCNFSNTSGIPGQGNADTNALEVIPDESGSFTRALQFTNCTFSNCREDAVKFSARDTQFSNCSFFDGGKAASNTYSGLTLGADAEDVIVHGCRFSQYGANNTWKHGLSVLAGAVRILANDNYIFNAQTKPINWLCTDANSRCHDNLSETRLYTDDSPYINPASIDLSAGNATATAAQTLAGIVIATGAAVARDLTLATAAQIAAAMNNPSTGIGITLTIINTGSATVSIAGGAGLTMNGNTSSSKYAITAGSSRTITMRMNNITAGAEAVAVYG